MGIGAAFATGLLKGFSDNMDKEGLRRQAMRDRFNGYETMAVDAVLKGDATTGGLDAIRNLVQKANTEIDSMEPIGPFGARGRDVTMDMAKVQSALRKTGDESVLNIGSYKLQMSPNEASRYAKDQGDTIKKARLEMNTFNRVVSTPEGREEFLNSFKGNVNNTNALRRFVLPNIKVLLAEQQKANGGIAVDPRDAIKEYGFLSDLLGLGVDGKLKTSINAAKPGYVEFYNNNLPADQTDESEEGGIQPISVTGVTAVADFRGTSEEAFQMLPISSLTENGIDIGLVDLAAKSQGRGRDIFLTNFSSQFNSMSEFMTGLKHATRITELASDGVGQPISFLSSKNVLKIGEYFERKELNDSGMQVKIIEGLQGPIISNNERHLIEIGAKTEDDYRLGNNAKEAFVSVFGNTLEEFNTRLDSARKAREQLDRYKDIISGITTVKDSVLDSTLRFIDSIAGDTGAIDQVMAMVSKGGFENEGERLAVLDRVTRLQGQTGARSQRDTLAFIIAANMARAEDQGGRLSDGDIQRNLDKLAPGRATKATERLSVNEVIISIDSQLKLLSETNALILERGQRGFDLDLQRKVRALNTRDEILAEYRQSRYETVQGDAINQMSFEEANVLEDRTSAFPATNSSYSVVVDNTGNLTIIDRQNKTVIATGKPRELTDRGLITTSRTSTGNQTVTPPASNVNPADRPAPLDVAPVPPTPSEINAVEAIDLDSPAIRSGNFYKLPGKGDSLYEKKIRTDGSEYYILNSQGTN